MKPLGQFLAPTVVLAAVASVSDPRPAPKADPQQGVSSERTVGEKAELRPTEDGVNEKRPAVRVILPSPYSARR